MFTLAVCPVLEALLFYDKIEHLTYAHENILITCPCLDHDDDRPSCSVSLVSGLWKCHGCEQSGNYQQLVKLLEEDRVQRKIDDWELAIALAIIELDEDSITSVGHKSHTIQIKRKSKRDERIQFLTEEFFYTLPRADWDVIQSHYLQERNFTADVLKHFDIRLNHASAFSIVIPIKQQGVFVGYTARKAYTVLAKETKYWNNPGFCKTETVFGNLETGPVLIVEGPLDMIKAYQLGFTNVCCVFGWHISTIQAVHIQKYATSIITGFDNDERGEQGYIRAKEVFQHTSIRKLYFPPHIKDIGEIDQQAFSISLYMPEIFKKEKRYGLNARNSTERRKQIA